MRASCGPTAKGADAPGSTMASGGSNVAIAGALRMMAVFLTVTSGKSTSKYRFGASPLDCRQAQPDAQV